ncbi:MULTISPECIES: GNAT family N-acetyltransferase [Ruegeria]|uniref:GNAT family N-acetyltransferase n=1 Tax=Ruegeria TaxID=97050 RepID=UPI00147A0BD7|nr:MULTISPECIES: GNAT family N-acetyltransferase [Ruegeria]
MTHDLIVRPLRETDASEWRRLWTAYLDFYDTSVSEEVYDTSFARLLSGNTGEYRGLIAEMSGRPVGLAHFLYHRSMWSVEDTCYLMDLFCDVDVRGRGVARALIEGVHARAKADGVPTTYWMTQEFNYKGRMLYDKVATKTPFLVYHKDD